VAELYKKMFTKANNRNTLMIRIYKNMAITDGSLEIPSSRPQLDAEQASIIKLRPHQDEVVFNLEQTPLPTFHGLEIETETEPKRRHDLETGNFKTYERTLTLTDGTRFKDLISLSDTADGPLITGNPAWLTSLDGGINAFTNAKLNQINRNTHWKGIPENRANSLHRNAWDTHLALDSAQLEYGIDTSTVDVQGDSNGAMTGTGVITYGPEFARKINDAFLVDPCMVQKIGREDIVKFLKHPEYPFKEVYCLGKQVVRIFKKGEVSLGDLAGTAEMSTEYVIGNILLARALFWGEFGHVAAHLPEDQQAQYYLFNHSLANQKRMLMRILRGSLGDARPDVTWETHTGTHLSIANPATVEAKVDYFRPAA
jgi:hypothetical protein